MAYVAPKGTTKLVDGATVANDAYSTAAVVAISSPPSPIIWHVNCNQTHAITMGTAGQHTTTQAELDVDPSATRTGVAATATYGTTKYVYYPDAAAGIAWLQVQNKSGAANATVTVYGGQL